MKTLISFLTLLMLVLSFAAYSQEPVTGVDNPESLFVDDNPVLNRNKQAALHIVRELLQCNQWGRASEWLTKRYIQHNPNAKSGRDGVVYFFTHVLKRKPTKNCGKLTIKIVAVMADDDYVTVLYPRTLPDPRNPGQTYTTSWFDTWRFVGGRADEHWDPAEIRLPNKD
jgi:predicted SnoaL-like aldol condensation-catalyzing enzyme